MSRRRARRSGGHEEEEANSERWLLTYADMITLLLALFIVLFSISTINQKKFLALALGLKETFDPKPGVLPNSSGVLNQASLVPTSGTKNAPALPDLNLQSATTTTTTTLPLPPKTSAMDKLEQQINQALAAKGLQGNVSIHQETRGLVVQVLADQVFFQTGSADLGSKGIQVVDAIASVLATNTYSVDVEGYTDDQPVTGGRYGSNEELSAVRAVNVVLRLSQVDGIDPSRLAATGYGATHPVAPNDTPAHMAMNRRIDFVILTPQEGQP